MPITFTEKMQEQKSDHICKLFKPQIHLSDVILNNGIKEQILDLIAIPDVWETVFDKWKLSKVVNKIPKMAVNFYGQSGTGKTMIANAIATETEKMILQVNYAEIESKYVGETSKNLTDVFKTATETDAILLFDEADALLSRRVTDMKNALDVSVNQTRSVLLNLLDEYTGMVIFTTNFISNFDSAFMRRIPYHIKIDLPDLQARENLWSHYLIDELPNNVNQQELVFNYPKVSGADIVNSIVTAAIKAARNKEKLVEQKYIEEALNNLQASRAENYCSNVAFSKSEVTELERG
ncbi:ATP-binding protein [Clostridium transplantifaecale]|uniref:ATP-binding protein n=1 Tax=Clostridium transplantifaecale TaxID=2479838 RepID=UPI000F63E88F|nr:ATP-binding protein [Clostridium transplantifaecale]